MPQRDVRCIEPSHLRIEIHRAKRFRVRRTAKELTVIIQQKTRPLPVACAKRGGGVLNMARRFLLIDKDDVEPALFQALTDIREPVEHLESAFARLTHADDDQSVMPITSRKNRCL